MYDHLRTVFLSVKVKIVGFRHKQSILLSKIMDKMTQFTVDQRRFAVHKENLARQLKNFRADQPYKHALYFMGVLLVQPCWTNAEMEEAIEGENPMEHGPLFNHLSLPPSFPPSSPSNHHPPNTEPTPPGTPTQRPGA